MSSNASSRDRDLKIKIANAKWDVQYYEEKVEETERMERDRSILGKLFSKPAVDHATKAEELADLNASRSRLSSLVKEARQRGIDAENIPALSKNDSYGALG